MKPIRRGAKRNWLALLLSMGILLCTQAKSLGQDTATLLRLVPPHSPFVLSVENLRDHYSEFISSSLAEGLLKLPTVREWMDSARYKKLISSRDKIEAFLGTPISEVRDSIFGDAAVLTLQTSPETPPGGERIEGVLLLRARNRELLQRLVHLIDDAQVAGGELARCVERREGETVYVVREYPAAAKRRAEYHVDFVDGTFALSNSESLIREVIDRRRRIESGAGLDQELAGVPGFQEVSKRLPEPAKATCRLFIDRKLIEKVSSEIRRPGSAANPRVIALISRYLSAIEYAGAAFIWNDSVLALQTAESIDPTKLDPAIVHWAKDPRPLDQNLALIPSTAFAFASAGIDYEAFNVLLSELIPEEQRPRIETFEIALSGLMLGQDLHKRIFPALGPSWIAYFAAPKESAPTPRFISAIPLVVVAGLNNDQARKELNPEKTDSMNLPQETTVAASLDNALRTILAFASIDHKRNGGRNRLVSREAVGAQVTTLDPPIPFAYAVDREYHRMVLGNSSEAVADYLEARADTNAGARFRKIREIAMKLPDAVEPRAFIGLDFQALYRLADRRRDQLASILAERRKRAEAEPAHDLEQVLALIRLFDSAFATSRVEPDARASVRCVGLVAAKLEADPAASSTARP